jgi:hypothetical protein
MSFCILFLRLFVLMASMLLVLGMYVSMITLHFCTGSERLHVGILTAFVRFIHAPYVFNHLMSKSFFVGVITAKARLMILPRVINCLCICMRLVVALKISCFRLALLQAPSL